MKKFKLFLGVLALVALTFSLVMACDSNSGTEGGGGGGQETSDPAIASSKKPGGGGGGGGSTTANNDNKDGNKDGDGLDTVTNTSIDVPQPKVGSTIVRIIDNDQYAGTIVWKANGDVDKGPSFGQNTAYTAEVALEAKTGWTFKDIAKNGLTVNDSNYDPDPDHGQVSSKSNLKGTGTTIDFTVVFTATDTYPLRHIEFMSNDDGELITYDTTSGVGTIKIDTFAGGSFDKITGKEKADFKFTLTTVVGVDENALGFIEDTTTPGIYKVTVPKQVTVGGTLAAKFLDDPDDLTAAGTVKLLISSYSKITVATSLNATNGTVTADPGAIEGAKYKWTVGGTEVTVADNTVKTFAATQAGYQLGQPIVCTIIKSTSHVISGATIEASTPLTVYKVTVANVGGGTSGTVTDAPLTAYGIVGDLTTGTVDIPLVKGTAGGGGSPPVPATVTANVKLNNGTDEKDAGEDLDVDSTTATYTIDAEDDEASDNTLDGIIAITITWSES